MQYQSSTLASGNAAIPTTETTVETFAERFKDVCRRLQRSAVGLTDAQRQLLWDCQRREGRYGLTTVRALLAISRQCASLEDRVALIELLRAETLGAPMLIATLHDAFDAETRAQAECDVAQWRYLRSRCATSREQLIEAGQRQLAVTSAMLDRLYCDTR